VSLWFLPYLSKLSRPARELAGGLEDQRARACAPARDPVRACGIGRVKAAVIAGAGLRYRERLAGREREGSLVLGSEWGAG